MRKYFRLFLLLGVICATQYTVNAQETQQQKDYQLKMYYRFFHSSFDFGPTTDEPQRIYEYASTDFGRISPAFVIKKNRMRHEVELSNFGIKRNKDFEGVVDAGGGVIPVEGARDFSVNIQVRYEFAFNLLPEESRHGLFLGASAQPYFDYLRTAPLTSASFPTNTKIIGTRLHLMPRYTYDISKKWFVDVNFPIEAMNALAHRYAVDNPILTQDERVGADSQVNFFDKIFQFRLGIGLKI